MEGFRKLSSGESLNGWIERRLELKRNGNGFTTSIEEENLHLVGRLIGSEVLEPVSKVLSNEKWNTFCFMIQNAGLTGSQSIKFRSQPNLDR